MNAEQLRINARLEHEHWWFVGRRRILQALITRLLPPSPETLIIDVGCGTGGNIGALARFYGVIGIDTSPDAIALARQRFPSTRFICGYAPDDLGSAARDASCYLLMDVLEHVRDDFALFSALVEAASPGTYFVLTVPAGPELWSEHDESHLHYRRYDRQRLGRLWCGLPVCELAVSYFNTRLYRPIRLARLLSRLRGRAGGEAGTDLWMPSPPMNRALTAVLSGERLRLVKLIDDPAARGYSRGVSLLAVLQRGPGACAARGKPCDVAADRFDPVEAGLVGAAT